MNLFSTSADVPQKQIAPRPIPCFQRKPRFPQAGLPLFSAFPVEKRAPVIVQERARLLREPNGVFSTRCNAMFRTLDDHVAYSNLPMKFPKGDINARQQALVLLTILIGASQRMEE